MLLNFGLGDKPLFSDLGIVKNSGFVVKQEGRRQQGEEAHNPKACSCNAETWLGVICDLR